MVLKKQGKPKRKGINWNLGKRVEIDFVWDDMRAVNFLCRVNMKPAFSKEQNKLGNDMP